MTGGEPGAGVEVEKSMIQQDGGEGRAGASGMVHRASEQDHPTTEGQLCGNSESNSGEC